MRCCVSLAAVWLVLASAPLDAQVALLDGAPASAPVVETVAQEVAAAIAERWQVDAATVVVELASDGEWPAPGTAFRLTGSGSDGRWAVWFDAENGARQLLVRAGVQRRVITAARDLERGTELTAADLVSESGVHWGPPQSAEVVVAGWVTRRRIAQGETIHRPAAEPRRAVKAGDDVRIEVVYGAITLTLTGRAAGNAAIGETVGVRAQTGKRLEGVVVGPGHVRIGTVQEAR